MRLCGKTVEGHERDLTRPDSVGLNMLLESIL